MKLKSAISLLFIASLTTFFSACSSAESKVNDEVVIDKSSTRATEEVYITNADVKKNTSESRQLSTMLPGGSAVNSTLSDSSKVETLTDAFGNKAETRYFEGHPRVRMIILRTSVRGVREVTVYGKGGNTTLVNNLGDRALSASADEIADAAGITSTTSSGPARNYLKRQSSQSSQSSQPLQPLPSSSFQKPVTPVNQPSEATSTETATQPANPEEDED